MVVETQQEPQTVGELIRFWRNGRRLSQLELAVEATLSTKHLSFVAPGRSRPSRRLLIHLAQRLDLRMAERNRLLLAGGFAPPTSRSHTTEGDAATARVAAAATRRPPAEPGADRGRALEPDRGQPGRLPVVGRRRP